MDLRTNTSRLLKEKSIKAKKHLGQNFLISEKALNKIVNSANITEKDFVLEIGPGTGNLTKLIFAKTKNLVCLEKDPDMIKTLSQYPVQEMDALKYEPSQLPKNYKLVANIPYYITSPIINHYLKTQFIKKNDNGNPPKLIILLIQKEVAEKICDPNYNSFLSINIKTFGKPSIAGIVKKGCFYPAPKVDSAILKIEVFDNPVVNCDLEKYFRVCSFCFANPRKKLSNNIKPLLKELNIDQEQFTNSCPIDLNLRSEKLSPKDFEEITNIVYSIKNN
jgi:16S rRNA (adenine1518-N6/adenine1519-N6)-dimethyltransferase